MKARNGTRLDRRRPRLLAALAALALGCGMPALTAGPSQAAAAKVDNPYVGATPYVNPDWSAKAAAEPGGTAVSNNPSFVWMDRIAAIDGTTGARGLRDHLDTALSQGATLFQVVIYDLPGRDCAALASNGELGPTDLSGYESDYIDPIAQILGDSKYANLRIVALIEPDSLPNIVTNADGQAGATTACATMKANGNYEKGVGYALHTLAAIPNVYNYIDAGHHGWLGWDTNLGPAVDEFKKAATSSGATVNDVHGFAVNTANYSALIEPNFKVTDTVNGNTVRQSKWVDWNYYVDEQSYAVALRDLAISRGGFNSSIGMLIDTARNGWGGSSRPTATSTSTDLNTYVNDSRIDRRIHPGNWCNQVGAGIGERPKAAPATGIDAYVWAKPPGESDGNSAPIANDEGKGFDGMCDPTYAGNGRNGNSPTGAMAGSPLAGHWFSAQFQQLLANAYPPVDGSGNPGGGDDTQAPSVPQNLRVTATTSSSVSLSWSASTDNTAVSGYDIYRGSTKVSSTAGTSYTDSGLSASTAYTYTVKARDAAGNTSAASSSVTGTTNSSGGSTGSGTLTVRYKNNDSSVSDNQIRPGLQLVNTGSSAVNLSGITLRYYFTGDGGSSTFTTNCDYAVLGCGNLTLSTGTASGTGADHYFQVSFGSGTLAAGASTGDIQLRLNKSDWSNFDESNDYSYGASTSYADAPSITVYQSGTLVYGTAP